MKNFKGGKIEKLTSNLPMSFRRGTKRRRLIVLVTVAVIGLLAEAALALSMVTFGMGGKFVIEDGIAVLIGEGRRELTGEPMSVVLNNKVMGHFLCSIKNFAAGSMLVRRLRPSLSSLRR